MSDTVTVDRKRWKQHHRYVRRLRRKERQKAIQVAQLQRELRAFPWWYRHIVVMLHTVIAKPDS